MSIKILSIGSDRKLFENGSAVSERIKEQGKLVEELHIVVFTLRSMKLEVKRLGENVWIYPTNSFSKWFYVHDAASLGKRIVLEKRFVRGQSVITTQDPFEAGWVGMKVKNKWRLPLEVQLHTDPFSPYFIGFLNKIRKIIARRVLDRADGIRVVSEELKGKIAPLTSAPIHILPIYIEKEKIENGRINFDIHARYDWRIVLLSVARLEPEKNLTLALEALKLVRTILPDAGLVIVGAGSEKNKLEEKIRELNLVGAVEFAGWQDDLVSYYKTADLFLQTSLFEGYGLALVEAGLSGLPVVTTPVGLAKEFEHGKEAYIYPSDRPDLFASGIIDLLDNKFKREALEINLKRTLIAKLMSKEVYLGKMKENWENLSTKVSL